MTHSRWRSLFLEPLHDSKQWGIVAITIIILIFTPQVSPNDWWLNTHNLPDGLRIYDNPSYVYPPWALILLWPYRLMTAPGSLVATGLVVTWLCYRQRWSLWRYFAIRMNPFFLFTLMFSNVDILVMIFPLLLWEAAQNRRWQIPAWGFAMALLLLKPQGGIIIIPYLLWQYRQQTRVWLYSLLITGLFVVPISLLGSPPLISQWLDNLAHPSAQNQEYWQTNNVSLTQDVGLIPAAAAIIIAVTGIYVLMRHFKRTWTQQHTLASLFLFVMLVSPYTSNQSMVVPVTLVPSWPTTVITLAGAVITDKIGIYTQFNSWWTLLFGLSALWFFRDVRAGTGGESAS